MWLPLPSPCMEFALAHHSWVSHPRSPQVPKATGITARAQLRIPCLHRTQRSKALTHWASLPGLVISPEARSVHNLPSRSPTGSAGALEVWSFQASHRLGHCSLSREGKLWPSASLHSPPPRPLELRLASLGEVENSRQNLGVWLRPQWGQEALQDPGVRGRESGEGLGRIQCSWVPWGREGVVRRQPRALGLSCSVTTDPRPREEQWPGTRQ